MAANGDKEGAQVKLIISAFLKQAGRFKAKNPAPVLAAAASLAGDGVCARCLMRVAGHTVFEDYARPAPSGEELQRALAAAAAPQRVPSPSPPPLARGATPEGAPGSSAPTPQPAAEEEAAEGGAAAAAAGAAPAAPAQEAPDTALNNAAADAAMPDAPPRGGAATAANAAGSKACSTTGSGAGSGAQECPMCFGLLPRLFDDRPLAQQPAVEAGTTSGAAAAAAAAVSGVAADGAAPLDAAWLRLQLRAVAGGGGGPLAGHELLPPGAVCAAGVAAAALRQAEQGPPGAAELMAAAAVADAAAAGGGTAADVEMADAAGAAAEQGQPPLPPRLRGLHLGPPLPLRSFCLEVGVGPASAPLRELAVHAALSCRYEGAGVPCGGWRVCDITPITAVLRRGLPPVLAARLGLEVAAPQSADLTVSLAALDGGEGLADVRALLEDQAALQARRNAFFGGNDGGGRGGGRHGRANKRQRQNSNSNGQQGRGGGKEAAAAAVAPPVPESRVRSMTADQALAASSSMPRHVVLKTFPWPPRPRGSSTNGNGSSSSSKGTKQEGGAAEAGASAGTEPQAGAGASAASAKAAGTEPTAAAAAEGGVRVYVRAERPPILLAGRYCKLRRHMPQSPWFDMDSGTRIGGVSVQEAIESWLLPLWGCCTAKMVTGGREDADVRMLGAGRPFILELQAPLRGSPPPETLREVERRMRESKCGATAQGLTPCGRPALEAIKAAEDSKEKTYSALCWATWSEQPPPQPPAAPAAAVAAVAADAGAQVGAKEAAGAAAGAPAGAPAQHRPLPAAALAALVSKCGGPQGVVAMQDTPVRVLHRRAAKIRPKWLRVEGAELVAAGPEAAAAAAAGAPPSESHYFVLKLRTQAGAYVKEFCHGDFGRCRPCLADVLGEVLAELRRPVAVAAAAGAGAGEGQEGTGQEGAGVQAAAPVQVHCEIVQLDVLDVHLEDWP